VLPVCANQPVTNQLNNQLSLALEYWSGMRTMVMQVYKKTV